ncbi:hypothetical protein U9M48_037183 [Paspalum notatum var. saurae]|uniref:Uncharacterized protein n=1 Tax=Paspalum notatum var. saurae TaxID=547442 RepID=A0AAQ3UFF5_PASNO
MEPRLEFCRELPLQPGLDLAPLPSFLSFLPTAAASVLRRPRLLARPPRRARELCGHHGRGAPWRADSGAREHAARDLPGAWMGQIRVMQRLPRARSPEPSVIAGEICLPPPQWLPRARSPRHGGRKRRAVSGPAPCRSRSTSTKPTSPRSPAAALSWYSNLSLSCVFSHTQIGGGSGGCGATGALRGISLVPAWGGSTLCGGLVMVTMMVYMGALCEDQAPRQVRPPGNIPKRSISIAWGHDRLPGPGKAARVPTKLALTALTTSPETHSATMRTSLAAHHIAAKLSAVQLPIPLHRDL